MPRPDASRPDASLPRRPLSRLVLGLAPVFILAGGAIFPELGLVVPLILLVAVLGGLTRRRWFCSAACPRASLLDILGSRLPRRRPLPPALRSPALRMTLCGMLMLCAVGQTARLWPSLRALGAFFWLVCLVTLGLSLLMAFLWKPRAWCAVCPVGALQDTIAARTASRPGQAD